MRWLVVLLLVGCAHAPVEMHEVANASELPDGCQSLGAVFGSDALGFGASRRIEGAKQGAMREAKKRGATHIVWKQLGTDYGTANASGVAYRCE